ncbi:T-complex 11 [Xylariaceae sp. FL0016]|nr:T-complex 11 [Xylariaceae sp. FL0016]
MGDQGAGGISRGVDNNATARRTSIALPNSPEDSIQQPTTTPENSTPECEEQKRVQRGPRSSTLQGLSRNSSTSSNCVPRAPRPLEPPVTKATLSELDVTKIIHNPKLRHDINFDPELHFRPNLDGEKGKRKQDKANLFWKALRDQLELFVVNRDEFMSKFGQGEEWCLPLLLKSVKEIIQTLVPTRDRLYLDEGLNVDLIMQQFSRGMADLEKLASWLSAVLKSHCAPMRDEWVDQMYNQLTNGNRTNDMEELVDGMRSLLSVLEAMKLDVANHQIRCLRPILIEDTVHFEQRFFIKKIRDQKLDPTPARNWYADLGHSFIQDPKSSQAFGEMAPFFEAISRMVLPSYNEGLPNTFLFDEERMHKLQNDMLDAINLEICMRLYEKFEQKYRPFSDASSFLSGSKSDDEGSEFNFNSRPSSMVFSSAGSAPSSPRPSSILPLDDQMTKSRNLYNSLVAQLQPSNNASRSVSRWKELRDSLAVEVFRFAGAPNEELPKFEQEFDMHLSKLDSPLFMEVEQYFHRRMLRELQMRIKEFKGLTGVGLFSVATGSRLHGPGRETSQSRVRETADNSVRETREEGGVEDMATRLAHLGLLHWRVWAQLAYVGDVDTDMVMTDLPAAI